MYIVIVSCTEVAIKGLSDTRYACKIGVEYTCIREPPCTNYFDTVRGFGFSFLGRTLWLQIIAGTILIIRKRAPEHHELGRPFLPLTNKAVLKLLFRPFARYDSRRAGGAIPQRSRPTISPSSNSQEPSGFDQGTRAIPSSSSISDQTSESALVLRYSALRSMRWTVEADRSMPWP